ncbi:hypothetical protein [Magnetospirillum sp. UT-4]|uniref:hypothetical protein n=1 Tax=Magnetospirillum sp. UT-4 TaxID=2681467 RepID=UPI00137D890E|nr:hypothetical protein [Magnetospirillum sp. UT-4]CAA7617871.1 conserved hypothetical protein [Magnetospirillum sp. UT-4]
MAEPHLWLALSPHGYGHAVMTAPVIAEVQRRLPGLRLTIQTALPRAFLETRYQGFALVPEIVDFGFVMRSSTHIDLEASAERYRRMHADFDRLVATEAARLASARPDAVLSNVAYVPLAAAARAGLPALALSSLNWADMYDHYFGTRPEAPAILAEIRAAYGSARGFLRCTPAQVMTLPDVATIGPVARRGADRGDELRATLGIDPHTRIGLIAFGGIDHRMSLESWPILPGWVWLCALPDLPSRLDMVAWERGGVPFSDLISSVDVVVTKPGYGTFTEAALAGTAVLYVPRPDWPECPHLEDWLGNHARSLPAEVAELCGPGLELLLRKLFSLDRPPVAEPTGVAEAADAVQRLLS